MKILYASLTVIFLFLLFSGCSKINPKIEVPSYISIPNYTVNYSGTYNNGGPGSSHHKFTDVLVYANNKNMGMYPIPCRVPILSEGKTDILIKPVIKTNGVSSIRADYPFMKFYSDNPVLKRGENTVVVPVFDYFAGINFRWTENFEGSGYSIVGNTTTDTCFKRVAYEKFEGNYALEINAGAKDECTLRSSSAYILPTGGANVFLELNYKADQGFEVGIIGGASVSDMRVVGGVNASAGWNKIYLFLTPAVSSPPYNATYYVYFYIRKDNSVYNPKIYIDNIKLISQP